MPQWAARLAVPTEEEEESLSEVDSESSLELESSSVSDLESKEVGRGCYGRKIFGTTCAFGAGLDPNRTGKKWLAL